MEPPTLFLSLSVSLFLNIMKYALTSGDILTARYIALNMSYIYWAKFRCFRHQLQGVPKKTHFQNYRCSPTIHSSPQAWLAGSGDLSDVSACRMMILKVRFFWDTLYIDKNLLAISILFNKSENFQASSLAFGDICLIAFSLSLLLPSQQADSNLKCGTAFILLFSPSLGHSEEPSLSFSCLLFSCLTS